MKKRLFAGFLAMCMMFSVMPATALAEESSTVVEATEADATTTGTDVVADEAGVDTTFSTEVSDDAITDTVDTTEVSDDTAADFVDTTEVSDDTIADTTATDVETKDTNVEDANEGIMLLADGVTTFEGPAVIAVIGETKYTDLAEALAQGGTVTLLRDVKLTETIEIKEGNTATLNLNGNEITVEKNEETGKSLYAIDNYGTFILDDSVGGGSIIARGVENFGTMTVENGRITSCDTNGGAAIWNEANLTVNGGTFDTVSATDGVYDPGALNNSGTAALNGGTFDGNGNLTYAIISSGNLTVNKGTTVTGTHGALAVNGGECAVNGGTFTLEGVEGQTDHVVYASTGKLTINDGAFVSNSTSNGGHSVIYVDGAEVEIKGGSYTGGTGSSNVSYGGGSIEISGGIFSKTVDGEHCANGYKPVDLDNGTYGVSVEHEAYIQREILVVYETLKEALANVENGETVTLLDDVIADEIITIDKEITLDGNGYTLTSTADRAINVDCAEAVTIKNLTVKASGERGINVINNPVDLTLDNVEVSGVTHYAVNVTNSVSGMNLTVKDSKLEGYAALNVWGKKHTITVTNSELIGINSYKEDPSNDFAAVVLNTPNLEITINGGSIVAESNEG